jgi:hypothetical protein
MGGEGSLTRGWVHHVGPPGAAGVDPGLHAPDGTHPTAHRPPNAWVSCWHGHTHLRLGAFRTADPPAIVRARRRWPAPLGGATHALRRVGRQLALSVGSTTHTSVVSSHPSLLEDSPGRGQAVSCRAGHQSRRSPHGTAFSFDLKTPPRRGPRVPPRVSFAVEEGPSAEASRSLPGGWHLLGHGSAALTSNVVGSLSPQTPRQGRWRRCPPTGPPVRAPPAPAQIQHYLTHRYVFMQAVLVKMHSKGPFAPPWTSHAPVARHSAVLLVPKLQLLQWRTKVRL